MLFNKSPPQETTHSYLNMGSTKGEAACSLLRSLLIDRPVREKSLVVVLGASMQVDVLYRFSGRYVMGTEWHFPEWSVLLRAVAGARSHVTVITEKDAIGKVENRNRDFKDWVIEKAI